MKQLEPVLQILNSVILEQMQLGLQLVGGESLEVESQISRVLVGLASPDEGADGVAGNGVTVEDIKLGLEGLKLPSKDSPGLSATVRVDQVTLKFANPFWSRAAVLAKEPLVANLGKLLDRIHVDKLKVKLDLSGDKIVDVEVWLQHVEITLAGRAGVTVDDVHLRLEDFNLNEKNRKLALKQARLVIYSVVTRVAEEFLNRAIDVARKKIPSLVQSLDFDLGYERMLVTSKLSVFPMAIPTELTFSAENNLFGIYIVKVAIGLARPIILGLAKKFAANRPEVEVKDSKLCINPWGKIPIPTVAHLSDFAIRERHLVVGFSPPRDVPPSPRTLPSPAAEPIQEDGLKPQSEVVDSELSPSLPPLP